MGNMADQNRFWSAKWSNWSENGQWPTVISSTGTTHGYAYKMKFNYSIA